MRRLGVLFGYNTVLAVPSGLAASFAALALLAGAGEAQQAPRPPMNLAGPADEVLIGTIDVNSRNAAASTAAANGDEQAAASLYSQALEALNAGNFEAAERLFEKSIVAAPDGQRAADARRHLGQLYTAAPAQKSVQNSGQNSGNAGDGKAAANSSDGRDAPGNSSEPELGTSEPNRPTPATAAQEFLTEAGDRIFFSASSAELGTRAHIVLAAQARWLVKRPEWNVTIEGHADDPPLNSQELDDLSEARAEAVRQRLIANGVAAQRISIVPWGRQVPISDCPESGCQAQNRRAVSVLTPRRAIGQSELKPSRDRVVGRVDVPKTAARSDSEAR
jgi:peptidoglycan-associated lipoprotein